VGYEEVFAGHVLPVVRFRRTALGEYEPVRAVGFGFTFGEGTFITCWHCVSEPLGDGEVYGAAMRSGGITSQSYDQVFELADLEQDDPAAWGEDVVACGYPLPVNTRDPDSRETKIDMNACLLRGYVTRLKTDDRPGQAPVRAYELDMPAPGGISGSPLFRQAPFEVVGVVYGEQDQHVPGREAPVIFSYAHHLSALRAARAAATCRCPST